MSLNPQVIFWPEILMEIETKKQETNYTTKVSEKMEVLENSAVFFIKHRNLDDFLPILVTF